MKFDLHSPAQSPKMHKTFPKRPHFSIQSFLFLLEARLSFSNSEIDKICSSKHLFQNIVSIFMLDIAVNHLFSGNFLTTFLGKSMIKLEHLCYSFGLSCTALAAIWLPARVSHAAFSRKRETFSQNQFLGCFLTLIHWTLHFFGCGGVVLVTFLFKTGDLERLRCLFHFSYGARKSSEIRDYFWRLQRQWRIWKLFFALLAPRDY